MTRLKKILPFSILLAIIICLLYCIININKDIKSKYNKNETIVEGIVTKINKKDSSVNFEIMGKELVLAKYYKTDFDYHLGDRLRIEGVLLEPTNNTTFNLFNYKKYLLSKKIKYIFEVDKIQLINKNNNIFYNIKNKIIAKINNNSYLNAFILGDTSLINPNILNSYRTNGVSHLFAVSGMHITFISGILLLILNLISKKYSKIILIMCLLFYAFLVNFTPSFMRATIFFILRSIKEKLNLKISTFNLFIILTLLFLVYNPYIIYNAGFIYSFTISGFLIFFNKKITSKNYFKTLINISLLAFLVSFPITIYNSFSISILSPLINIIFVPLVSLVIFPLSFLVIISDFLNPIYIFLINILESISLCLSNIKIATFTFARPSIIIIFVYYIIIVLIIENKKYIILLVITLLLHNNIHLFKFNPKLTFIDVGQGDSTLIELPHNKGNILVDTGGKVLSNNYLSNNITIPYLKSVGIKKIDYMIITHGDYDHMGEAINLVNNFKVENVIFNCGEFNELEKELINVLNKEHIKYYSCIKELNVDNNKLYFLNNKNYGNENDNSIVLYTKINNMKFLFMGDASVKTEKDIIKKYDLSGIDVIKVGHHGSKTSSSKEFIDKINPKYSVISVGENNRYGHPNNEVLEILDKSKVYRTNQDGSIMFNIKNNKLDVGTCPP